MVDSDQGILNQYAEGGRWKQPERMMGRRGGMKEMNALRVCIYRKEGETESEPFTTITKIFIRYQVLCCPGSARAWVGLQSEEDTSLLARDAVFMRSYSYKNIRSDSTVDQLPHYCLCSQ